MRSLLSVMFIVTLSWCDQPAWAGPEDVVVTDLELVSSRRVGRAVNEYVFQVEVDNPGIDLTNVIGTTVSNTPATTVVEGQIVVGDLASGIAIPTDTFVIRHNRRYRFSPNNLTFTFSGDEIATGDNAPNINSEPVTSAVLSGGYTYEVEASDADVGDVLTFSLQTSPPGMAINPQSGLISWVPDGVGQFDVDVLVSDSTGLSDRQIYLLQVSAGPDDQPPTLSTIPNQSVVVGNTLTLTASGSDPEGEAVRYGLSDSPTGAGINSVTGAFAWTPTVEQIGTTSVSVSVSDPSGQAVITSFDTTVLSESPNNPPMIAPISDQTVNAFSIIELLVSASDPDSSDILTFELSGAPEGLSFDAASGRLSWSPGTADAGVFNVVATVTDSAGASSSTSFSITVVEPPIAPVAVDDAYTISERGSLDVTAPGVLDNDRDDNNDVLTAAATSEPSLGTLEVFDADGSFQYLPPPIPPIDIGFDIQCDTGPHRQNGNRSIPVADVDADGELEFVTLSSGLYPGGTASELRIFDGATCALESTTLVQPFNGNTVRLTVGSEPITLVNLDADPELEVVAVYGQSNLTFPGPHLAAINLDGSPVWPGNGLSEALSDTNALTRQFGDLSPSAVDLDGDGNVELVVVFYQNSGASRGLYAVAYNGADGTLQWEAVGRAILNGPPPPRAWTIADIDLDGTVEILFGNTIFSHDGQVEFNFPDSITNFMELAVANFDDDPYAEIIAINRGAHRMFEHTGELKWIIERSIGHHGGITIAELDGDPGPEYLIQQNGVGENRHLAAFDGDGSPLWSHLGTEFELDVFHTARTTTPIAFDFDRDGIDELVSQVNVTADGRSDQGTHIFSGIDGRSLSNVLVEPGLIDGENGIVTIADVDADGEAEVLQVNNAGICCWAIRVLEGQPGNPFPPARSIRNQWLYHPTQVSDDGSIPQTIEPQWLVPGLNKQNVSAVIPGESEVATDTFQYVANDGNADSNSANVSIEIATVNAPTIISTPVLGASPGFNYEYAALATDADFGDLLTWSLVDSPVDMSVDGFGIVRWIPTTDELGSVRVSLVVTDSDGNTDNQVYSIGIQPPIIVPDVIGEGESDAVSAIEATGLAIGSVAQNYSLTVPAGSIISQSVIGGEEVGASEAIDVVVSLGPPPIFAPTLIDLNQSVAEAELEALGLTLGAVSFINSDDVPRGLVISQASSPGELLMLGDAVDVVLSSGPALRVDLDSRIIGAGETVTLSVRIFDVEGSTLPLGPVNVDVIPTVSAAGTIPMTDGLEIDTASDTRGAYAIQVDVPGYGVRQLDIVVREALDADAYYSPIADLARDIDRLSDIYAELDEALLSGDLVTVQFLAQSLVNIRDSMDLEILTTRNPFAPDSGFLPSVVEASGAGFAPGLASLETGNVLLNQLSAAIVDAQSYVDLLDPGRARNDDLRARVVNDNLETRIDQWLSEDLPVGTQLALNAAIFKVLALQVPEMVANDLDFALTLLADNGLARVDREGSTMFAGNDIESLYSETSPVFFSLGGMMSAISIRSRLWKKLYMPSIQRLTASSLVLDQAGLLQEEKAPQELNAIITGASQSFHIFDVNGSIIEGVDFSAEGRAFKVSVIGPDLYQGVVNVLAGASAPRSMGDFLRLASSLDNAADQGSADGNRDGKVNAVLNGCFFDANPACAQLILGAGFPVVHRSGAFPSPVLIVVEDLVSGQLYSGVYPFFPLP